MALPARAPFLASALAALVLCTTAIAPTAAYAHDQLVGSIPSNGATVTAWPRTVVLRFDEPPVDGYTRVRVVNAAGVDVATAQPATAGAQVTLALPRTSKPGRYSVFWSVLSDDGHPVAGTIHFSVATSKAASTKTVATSQVAQTTIRTGGSGLGWVAALAAGVGALGVVFAFGRRRGRVG